jgi:MYXO-CTERM domain-containing protein
MDMAFVDAITSFAFKYGSSAGTLSITAYDSNGVYVDSDSGSMSSNLSSISVSGSDIADIAVSVSGTNYGVLDDFEWNVVSDADGDGFASDVDCDDTDASIYPGATEYCDGVDNNCDGTIDEDTAIDALTWYADADNDGYGDASTTDIECYQPTGYVADNTDCNDSNNTTYPNAPEYCDGVDNDCDGTIDEDTAVDAVTWYADTDSDGYGDASTTDIECYQPTGYVADNTDCDDSNTTTYPTAPEYCDGVDNDCDGTIDEDTAVDAVTWYADTDSDGYGNAAVMDVECYQPTGYVADNTDCDDSNTTTYPTAPEYCDGVDNDCDGTVDEDTAVDALTWYADTDSDGYGDASTTDIECYQPTGYVADDTDCDDTDADTYPGADEWCDGHDDDCDGITDEDDSMDSITWYVDADGDGEGDPTISADSCYGATGYVENSTDCDDTDAALNTSDADGDGFTSCDSDCNDGDATINIDASEIWYDGVDQNCDGWSDYDQDGDGFDYMEYGGDDCDDLNPDINVDAAEIWYDGNDQDCDGLSDYDADYDGQESETYGGEDCDDADPDTYTGAPDTPYDGIINDCDNANDNDADGDGAISADYGGKDCDDANSDINPSAEEIWYDGVDQDCDGNDDDQDGDGYALDDDCDDTDAELAEDCSADTGGSDTGAGYDTLGKDSGGCFSSTTGGKPAGPWALLLAGLLFFRRKLGTMR